MATKVDARRETVSLIGSDKVEGTAVYGADGRKIGTLQRVMIDKISGKVAYAVVSFGGFLGMGEDYYPQAAEFRGLFFWRLRNGLKKSERGPFWVALLKSQIFGGLCLRMRRCTTQPAAT